MFKSRKNPSVNLVIAAHHRIKEREYWLNQLAGDLVKTGFPYDGEKSFNHHQQQVAVIKFELPGDLSEQLIKLSKHSNHLLHMILTAGVEALLFKYTGQQDIIVGIPIYKEETEVETGTNSEKEFINTALALRNQLHNHLPFKELLVQVRQSIIEAIEHYGYPLEVLLKDLNLSIPRKETEFPLFNTVVLLENIHDKRYIQHIPVNMVFSFELRGASLQGNIQYNSKLYRKAAVERLVSHFIRLSREVTGNINIPLSEITILSREELNQQLLDFNDSSMEYPADRTIHQLFRQQAQKTPDQIAVSFSIDFSSSIDLTYRELDERSSQWARWLRQKRVEPETIVGIMSQPSQEMIVGILAVLKAGAAYLPIHLGYPEQRIELMLEDSCVRILLAQPAPGNSFESIDFKGEIIDLFDESLHMEEEPEAPLPPLASSPGNLAYVIYTSGSTGKPKGVLVQHRNVVRLVKNPNYIQWQTGEKLLLTGSIAFDITTFEIWGPLLNGLTLCLADRDRLLDPEALERTIEKQNISILHLIPQWFNQVAANRLRLFGKLDYLLVGGDLVAPGYVNEARKAHPHLKIRHMYGPTENTTFSTYWPVEEMEENRVRLPIGHPISNSTVYILDQANRLKPIGAPGELCVGGNGLARGYLNNPELTDRKFCLRQPGPRGAGSLLEMASLSSEFYPRPYALGPRLYQTGDLARWLRDGNIEFLGRIDNQVKIRGARIELQEIENRLLMHHEIKEAVVMDRQIEDGDKYLCAYVVAGRRIQGEGDMGDIPDSSVLRDYLSERLPEYMIPSNFVFLDKMPLTPTGKIDRKVLPAPGTNDDGYTPPGNKIEKQLVEIWSEVLGLEAEKLSINANFFQLGGHSLKATTLISQIHKALDVKLSLTEVFRITTIRGQARHIRKAVKDKYASLEPIEKKEYYTLSSAQKRVYFIQQLDINSTSYNMPFVLPLGKNIEKDKLETTLKQLILRHESLRTFFLLAKETPVQRIHDQVTFEMEYHDLTTEDTENKEWTRGLAPLPIDPPTRNSQLVPSTIKNFIRPFDLSRAPLLRSGLIKLQDGNHTWVVDMHHIISDGTSHMILTEDFISLYNGKELDPMRLRYKDFSQWQNQLFASGEIDTQEKYWLELYGDSEEIPRLNLPSDFKRPEVFTFAGDRYDFILEREDAVKFKDLGSKNNGTLYMNILTTLNTLFYIYTGQTDIILGSGIAGRPHADLRQIVGMFVNTLVLRNYPEGEKTYESFLQEVITHSLNAFENQDLQFEELVDKLGVERDPSRTPLFDVAMLMQNLNSEPIGKSEEGLKKENPHQLPRIEQLPLPDEKSPILGYMNSTTKFDMTFVIHEQGEDILIGIEYYTAIFKQETILRLVSHFKNILKTVVETPFIKLKNIEIISESERNQLLYEWNDTVVPYIRKTIRQLFDDQVEQRPNSIAVVAQTPGLKNQEEIRTAFIESVSYHELNKRAHQLAGLLKGKGVGPDVFVGIIVNRSLEMIVGIMGILKAGGAYLPIDPDFPTERMTYMLTDSGVKVLVTTSTLAKECETVRSWEGGLIILDIKSRLARHLGPEPAASQRSPQQELGPLNIAYLIYTSGSTGNPKGVIIKNNSLVNFIKGITDIIDFEEKDNILSLTTQSFDIFHLETLLPLTKGCKVIIGGKREQLNLEAFTQAIYREAVTILQLTPSRLLMIISDESSGNCLKSLKYLLVGGENFPEPLLDRTREFITGTIFNLYGPTETTIWSTVKRLDKGEPLNIGKPIANTRVYIVNKSGTLQPIGVAGELCIAGDGLAWGYLNRPELTAEKFIKIEVKVPGKNYESHMRSCYHAAMQSCNQASRQYQPHSPHPPHLPYSPIYRTGDLARWLADGNIEFLARIDHQVKLRGYRIELKEIENRLVNHAKIENAVVEAKEDEKGNKYLYAYIVKDNKEIFAIDNAFSITGQLRKFLSQSLPDYMIPSFFIELEKIPLTVSGKLDRKALPKPDKEFTGADGGYVPPGNKIEKMLVRVWQEVLGVESIGITDNFFEVGGDSIRAIIISSRLKKYRLNLNISDLFLHPIIKELAKCIKKIHRPIDQGTVEGAVPLTPIQRRFFDNHFTAGPASSHHFNQAVMLYRQEGFEKKILERVFTKIIEHHDALRMIYEDGDSSNTPMNTGVNHIRQWNRGLQGKLFDLEIIEFNEGLTLEKGMTVQEEIEKEAGRIQESIDLNAGPLVKLGLFKTPRGDHLLIVIHHLVVDGISWRILLEDLRTGYTQLQQGQDIKFQNKTDSFKHWAQKLEDYAAGIADESKQLLKEVDYWQKVEIEAHSIAGLIKDHEIGEKKKKHKFTETIPLNLNPKETQKLLKEVNQAYNTQINDILLTALGLALQEWAGVEKVSINLEGHGREPIFEEVDISRTLGWFTSRYPVVLDMSQSKNLAYAIKCVKETLRRIPNKGIGYGILRYLTPREKRDGWELKFEPRISFNYLGQFGQESTENTGSAQPRNENKTNFIRMSAMSFGKNISPQLKWMHDIDINGIIVGGRLQISLTYNKYEYDRNNIKKLAAHYKSNLLRIIEHCISREEKELTPSDLGYQHISLEEFARIRKHVTGNIGENVEIQLIYPLSPLQNGMLFYWLRDKKSSTYFGQREYQVDGLIDQPLLKNSFDKLMEKYDIFRTNFVYEGLAEPMQIVLKNRHIQVYYEDIAHLNEDEKISNLDEFKRKDKERGVDLSKDVLMRLALFKTGVNSCHIVWSFHHILMDGWCIPVIFEELIQIYQCLRDGRALELEDPAPYIEYIKWIEKQDKKEGLDYWKKYLEGYEQKTGLPGSTASVSVMEDEYKLGKNFLDIDEALTSNLHRAAAKSHVTINTIFQTTWGILLQKYNNSNDTVYGIIVSGRPAEIEGFESMIGLFINAVPLRITSYGDQGFSYLLKAVQERSLLSRSYEYLSLAEVQANSTLKGNSIDHIMIFENYPFYKKGKESLGKKAVVNIRNILIPEKTNYNLNIAVFPGRSFLVGFGYNALVYEKDFIEHVGLHYKEIIKQVVDTPGMHIKNIEIITKEEKQQILFDFNDTKTIYPGNNSIHQLFAEQTEKTPDKIAVVYNNHFLSYRELNNRANQLARHLRAKGVKPGNIVGIMVNHSLEMIVGILGILKAGGAYLPVNPALPLNRIISMLEDCCALFLITRQDIHDEYSITALQNLKAKKIKPFFTAPRPQIRHLDQLPIPDRSLINYEKYDRYIGQSMVKNSLSLQATRGCPYKCAYCHKVWPKTHVFRGAEHIYAEVKLYYDMGVRRFAFIDDIFNLDRKNSSRLFELIIKNDLDIHIFFPNGVRGDLLTKEYIDLMVKAGTVEISFALETASPRLQKLIKKNLNINKFRENIEYMINKYPQVIVDLFTMHGFPSETREEAMMTLDFIKSLKWIHFPYLWILKVYPDTDMEKLALEHGITPEDITASEALGYHELPETLPFEKSFTLQYRADFFNNYFLSKERLVHVLPHQMKLLREDEIVNKWNGYLPAPIHSFAELLQFLGIKEEELEGDGCRPDDYRYPPHFYQKAKACFPQKKPDENALRVLLLDVTLFFSEIEDVFFDTAEAPLGLMYLLTFLNRQFGSKVKGKIAKSRVDFDNWTQLKELLDDFKPDVIGIRALSYYKNFFHKIAAVIRQFGYDVPIVAGGPYVTTSCPSILQDKNVNLVVLGEGEVTFCELIQKMIENGGHLPESSVIKTIPGIAFVPREKGIDEQFAPEIVMVDAFYEGGSEKPGENPENINRSDDLAYAIFTSGSTGRPKGVLVEHKNVTRLVKNSNYIELEKEDRLLLTGAFAFDITTFELWAPLLNGLSLYLVDKEVILDANQLKEIISQKRISILHLIPQLFNTFAAQQPGIFEQLKYFLVGGDVVVPEYINHLKSLHKDLKILHMYGPTENTTFSTSFSVERNYKTNLPIGKPIGNSTVYIVDRYNNLQPIGIPGELCTGGDGVARGYLNRVELTKKKFGLHPLIPGERLYKTGDFAKWLPDGNIEFLGRRDQQVKIRGIRIELGEIENLLLTHKGIEACFVTNREMNGENQVIAYYKKKDKIELWPSLAEYFVYDDLIYRSMVNDESRNEKYRNAIEKVVKDKTVLEIGPGGEAILSRMCIEAGAKKVYAVEILEDAFQKASAIIKHLGLENKIILIYGDIAKTVLPEKFDCCVSEIVGAIGGSQGAAKLINSVHSRMEDPNSCHLIPSKSLTKIAAITLPEEEFEYSFEGVGAHYLKKIFNDVGRKFDPRLCLHNFPQKNIISTWDVFEQLDFTQTNQLEEEHEIKLEINANSMLSGFMVWLNLYCDEDEVIDTLAKKYIWLPVYFPVFPGGELVRTGDYIQARVIRKLSGNRLNPDYILKGKLYKKEKEHYKSLDFTYSSPHINWEYKGNDFYKKIFPGESLKITKEITASDLKEFLSHRIPDYMIPAYFVQIDNIPLTPNGKVDRNALPRAGFEIGPGEEYAAPRNDFEKKLVEIWSDVLNLPRNAIGIDSNFFELGGHSLKATILIARVHKVLDVKLPLGEVFRTPHIRELAGYIKSLQKNKYQSINPVEKKEYHALSSGQKRLYILQQLDPNPTAYNMPLTIPLTGETVKEKLERTFIKLIERHESLRTSYWSVDETPVQKVHEAHEIEFAIQHYEINKEQIEKTLKGFLKPFDLTRAPLIRVKLVTIESSKILFIDNHHIITDGASQDILKKEFMALYPGKELSPLRLQYKDFSDWQNREKQRESLKQQELYWLKIFSDQLLVLNLPTDYPRPLIQSFEGNTVTFVLNVKETQTLKEMAKESDVTLYMAILSAFTILLSKLCGMEDIIVGTPIAARRHADLEKIIGMFVNTLAMRNYPTGEKSCGEFLTEVKYRTLEVFENQEYQFEDLVERVSLSRDTSHNPIFDVMFNLVNQADHPDIDEPIEQGDYQHRSGTSKFDLELTAVDLEKQLFFTLGYCTRLFKPGTIERIIGYFKKIISLLPSNNALKLSQIEIVTESEKQQILFDFNDRKKGYPKDKTIHQLVETQVEKTPGNIAVADKNVYLEYRELNQRANQTAAILKSKGVKPDSIIGLLHQRSAALIIGLLGILKAGAAYLPIDPDIPEERVKFMLKDSAVGIMLTQQQYFNKYVNLCELIDPGAIPSTPVKPLPGETAPAPYQSGDLAYVTYTSGSTGGPKGVMVQHRAVINLIKGITDIIPFNQQSTILSLTTISFDIFGVETLVPLSQGSRVVLGSEEEQLNTRAIAAVIKKESVTIFQLTPSRLHLVLLDKEASACLQGLEYLLVGGEVFPAALLQKVRKKTKAKIYNGYGPTEAAIYTTIKELNLKSVNIGKPIANVRVYILNRHHRLQPVGIPGELCIAGDGLARGYINRPELTAGKFDHDFCDYQDYHDEKLLTKFLEKHLMKSFLGGPGGRFFKKAPLAAGGRLYRTGDLAKWLPNGDIEFLGRLDHQVKIRGFRIELKEIENLMLKHKAIKEVVVTAAEGTIKDETGSASKETYLCAYFAANQELQVSRLRDYLAARLPDYMIPSYFIPLERIPLNTNGKVNRRALPKPGVQPAEEYIPPKNETERILMEIWQKVLGIEGMSVNQNFFELGGHSQDIIKVNIQLKNRTGIDIPVITMFEYPSIAALAGYLTGKNKGKLLEEKIHHYEAKNVSKRKLEQRKKRVREN